MLTETRPCPPAPAPVGDPLATLERANWNTTDRTRTRSLLSASSATRLEVTETSDGREIHLYRQRHPGIGDGMIARFCLNTPLEIAVAAAHAAEACGHAGYEQQCPHPVPLLAEHGLRESDRYESAGRIGSITYSDPDRQVHAVMTCDHHYGSVSWRIHAPKLPWTDFTKLACPHVIAATAHAAAC